jgi:hypothetical protein
MKLGAHLITSSKCERVKLIPVPPATSTTVSSLRRSGLSPYAASMRTETLRPSLAAEARRFVKPSRTLMKNTSSFQYAPRRSPFDFSFSGRAASGELESSMLEIVNGCASKGSVDTPGRIKYAVCPGAQCMCGGRAMRRRTNCEPNNSGVASSSFRSVRSEDDRCSDNRCVLKKTSRITRRKRSKAQKMKEGQIQVSKWNCEVWK